MARYNPYESPGGSYVEIPEDMPASFADNYYRSVLASRQRPNVWADSINALTGVGTNYFDRMLQQQFQAEDERRKLALLMEELNYRDSITQGKELRERGYETQDYERFGRGSALWAEQMAPGPDTVNVYEEPGFTGAPEDVNLPGEPGGYVQLPGEEYPAQTTTETIPGRRPEMIDAWRRFAGQYPVEAGALQKQLGVSFGQSVLDPSYQDKRAADIRRTTATAGKTEATTNPEVERLQSVRDRNMSTANNLDVRTGDEEFKAMLRQQALRLLQQDPNSQEAQALLAVVAGRPWESAEQRARAPYQARQDYGLPLDKPRPAARGAQGPRPSATERMIQRYVDLEMKADTRTPAETAEYQVLKKRLMSSGQLEQILNFMENQSRQGGSAGTDPASKWRR